MVTCMMEQIAGQEQGGWECSPPPPGTGEGKGKGREKAKAGAGTQLHIMRVTVHAY